MTHSTLPIMRAARPEEASHLTHLAMRSKAYWGYSKEFMQSCEAELTVDGSRIRTDSYHCFVAVHQDKIVGFYALDPIPENAFDLAALFVEPDHIGQGVGRLLLSHAIQKASEFGAHRMTIQGDPHAARFYLAAGARQIGEQESASIPGRFLPLYEIDCDRLNGRQVP